MKRMISQSNRSKASKKGKECKHCHHAIYYARRMQAWRCGPSCDRAEPV
jgi:hypothetical protein